MKILIVQAIISPFNSQNLHLLSIFAYTGKMDSSRVSTGISSLDESLEGGLPVGSVIAYSGPIGSEKTTAGKKFIEFGLKNNTSSLIVTTVHPSTRFGEIAQTNDINLHGAVYVDAAFWRVKRVKPQAANNLEYSVPNLIDLNALLAEILKSCKEKNISLILFDTPSSLLLYSTPGHEQVFKFFELLTTYTRTNEITLVYILEENVHLDQITSTLLFLSDGQIIFSSNSDEKQDCKIQFMVGST